MKTIEDVVEAVRQVTGSDYRTGFLLGTGRQRVSGWRNKRSFPSNRHIIQMCEIAGLDLKEAILAIEYSRENERPMKEAGFADIGLLSVMAGMSLVAVSPTLEAATGAGLIGISYALYIMRSDGTVEIRLCSKVETHLDSSPLQQYKHLVPANEAIAA